QCLGRDAGAIRMIHRVKHLLHRNRHRERYALLDGLLHNQTLTREQLLGKQQNDLSAIIEHAYTNVPYYRKKYAQAVRNEANGLAVGSLPILHKDEVIQHRDEMLARGIDRSRLRIGNTGGSTGKPVSFYYDAYKGELMRAGMCRSYMGSGWQPGQKILNFWGARQDIKGGSSFRKMVNDAIAAEKTIAAYEYTEAQLHDWPAPSDRTSPSCCKAMPRSWPNLPDMLSTIRSTSPTRCWAYSPPPKCCMAGRGS
ncbi:MAG: hypothetical protein Q8S05_02875, partial [Sulfuricella sp.]|nr:hypothetical protein [Sulfuricella sp.]